MLSAIRGQTFVGAWPGFTSKQNEFASNSLIGKIVELCRWIFNRLTNRILSPPAIFSVTLLCSFLLLRLALNYDHDSSLTPRYRYFGMAAATHIFSLVYGVQKGVI